MIPMPSPFDLSSLSPGLLAAAAAGLVVAVARLLWSGAWSFAAGVVLAALLLLSLGALAMPAAGAAVGDAAGAVRGLEFVRPWWLVLLLVVPLVFVLAR